MVEETYQKIPNADEVTNNALIEAFCLHARNLIEFFEKKTDKYATGEYQAFFHTSKKNIAKIKRKINIQISHLIYGERATNDASKIGPDDRAEVLNILSDEIAQFKAHLLPQNSQSPIRDIRRVTVPVAIAVGESGANTTTISTINVTYFSP
jgi:hypothetical protein